MLFPKTTFVRFILVLSVIFVLVLPVRADSSFKVSNQDVEWRYEGEKDGPVQQYTNQVIVKFADEEVSRRRTDGETIQQPQLGNERVKKLSEKAGVELKYLRQMSGGSHVLRLPGKMPLEQVRGLAKRLETLGEVEYAVPDAMRFPAHTPNDPLYPDQWHYFSPSSGYYGINAPAAWDYTTGSSSIVVAVLDTGITNHSDFDFIGRVVQGYDFIHDSFVGNDGTGRDSDPSDPGDWIEPYECGSNDYSLSSSWHGTHVAGTIGAASNNGNGVAGVNWNSKILPVRVLGKCGGYDSDIIDAVRWSAGLAVSGVTVNPNPAKVINLSLGGSGLCTVDWQNAINDVVAVGATVVVAAGNDGIDASNFTPANCSNVITVAATKSDGYKSSFSNYGSTVEISAPGSYVYSTINSGTTTPSIESYRYMSGTSMAAPHVAGVVSLLYSLKPSLTATQVLDLLQKSATDFPSGSSCNTSNCGAGIVNAGAAVKSIAQTPSVTCTNLFLDPSFEESLYTSPAPWAQFSSNFVTPLCSSDCLAYSGGSGPRIGEVWAWFGGVKDHEEIGFLEQAVVIPKGKARLDFYLWIESAEDGSWTDDLFRVEIDGTHVFVTDATQKALYDSYKWVSLDVSSFADGGVHTVRFYSSTSNEYVNFFLDDVSLCNAEPNKHFFLPLVIR